MAGLAAACRLQGKAAVTLFEKSRGVAGRAATRRHPRPTVYPPPHDPEAIHYDHGANYFTLEDAAVERLVRSLDAVPAVIDAPIWTHDAAGRIRPGDPERDQSDKLTYEAGIKTLGSALHARSGADLRTRVRIASCERAGDGRWALVDDEGRSHASFDAVLLTAPGPQSAEILARSSGLDPDVQSVLAEAVGAASYRAQFTVVLGYEQRLAIDAPFYALVDTSGEHPVAWLGREEAKPGHVPKGRSVLVAQMSEAWTQQHYDDERSAVEKAAAQEVAALLASVLQGSTDLAAPQWSGSQRWRYALPGEGYADGYDAAESSGLFLAGDAAAGKGRVALALASGLEAGERIETYIATNRNA
jgi:predicted NAD/FAD-dependent oxidoreductase